MSNPNSTPPKGDQENTFDPSNFDVDAALAELRDHLREPAEKARGDVEVWDATVAEWHSTMGDTPIPFEAFREHPAFEIVTGWLRNSDVIDDKVIEPAAMQILSRSNAQLHLEIEGCQHAAAARMDTLNYSADKEAALATVLALNAMTAALVSLLHLRTATDDDLIAGFKVDEIAGYIRARTLDVGEGE